MKISFWKKSESKKKTKSKKTKKKKSESPATFMKWIHMSFSMYYGKKVQYDKVFEIAEDMAAIIKNTHAIFAKNGEFIGCVNPYLEVNAVMSHNTSDGVLTRQLSREFTPLVQKHTKGSWDKGEKGERMWRITIIPLKDNGEANLYSTPNLYYDMFILAQANQWIMERHNIKPPVVKGLTFSGPASCDIKMHDGHPMVHYKEPIMNFLYEVKLRKKSYDNDSELDTNLFGEDFYKMIGRIKEESKEMKLTNEQNEWLQKVEDIL